MNITRNPDSFGRIRLDFPLSFAFLLITIGILSTIAFSKAKDEETRNVYAFGTAVATTVATGVSAFYLLQSIYHNTLVSESGIQQTIKLHEERNREIKLNRSLDYMARWNSTQFAVGKKIAFEVHDLIEGKKPTEQESLLDEYLNERPRRKQEIAYVLNFLEELSIAHKNELIDEELSRKFFRGIVVEYCVTFERFIAIRRKQKRNDQLYRNIDELSSSWRNGNGSS